MTELTVHASTCETVPMVHIDELRARFAARLKEALSDSGINDWGAGVRLAEIAGVTPKAASKWLCAESMPGRNNMAKISGALGVRAEWLEYGEGPIRPGDSSEGGKVIAALTGSPRSRAILHSLTTAAAEGRLSDQDLELLDAIAQRLAHADSAQSTPMNQGHQKLRSKLQHDPVPDV